MELTKSITSILVNVTVPKDSISSKVSVLNVNLEKLTMSISKNVLLFLFARVAINSTQLLLKLVYVYLNLYVFKESVLTAPLDTTMTASVINVVANLATLRKVDSASLSVPVTKDTLMVNVNAAMD